MTNTTTLSAPDLLDAAADLLQTNGVCRNGHYNEEQEDGTVKYCIFGAMHHVLELDDGFQPYYYRNYWAARHAVSTLIDQMHHVMTVVFNDRSDSDEEVIAVVRQAAADLRAQA